MYSHKFAIVLCVVGVVSGNRNLFKVDENTTVKDSNECHDFKVIDSIRNELLCKSQGGLCTLAADCPAGHLVQEKGLCLSQQSKGVECCYGLSVKETRCEKRGGICEPGKKPCNKIRIYSEATDCPEDTTCCILVA